MQRCFHAYKMFRKNYKLVILTTLVVLALKEVKKNRIGG